MIAEKHKLFFFLAKNVATAGTALTRALSFEVILLAPAEGTVCNVAFSPV